MFAHVYLPDIETLCSVTNSTLLALHVLLICCVTLFQAPPHSASTLPTCLDSGIGSEGVTGIASRRTLACAVTEMSYYLVCTSCCGSVFLLSDADTHQNKCVCMCFFPYTVLSSAGIRCTAASIPFTWYLERFSRHNTATMWA